MTSAQAHNPAADGRYKITSHAGRRLAEKKVRELVGQERAATRKPDRKAALIYRWARWMLQTVLDTSVAGVMHDEVLARIKETYDRPVPDPAVMDEVMRIFRRHLEDIGQVDAKERVPKPKNVVTLRGQTVRKSHSPVLDRLNQRKLN